MLSHFFAKMLSHLSFGSDNKEDEVEDDDINNS